jgi:hypothetical protein
MRCIGIKNNYCENIAERGFFCSECERKRLECQSSLLKEAIKDCNLLLVYLIINGELYKGDIERIKKQVECNRKVLGEE